MQTINSKPLYLRKNRGKKVSVFLYVINIIFLDKLFANFVICDRI